MHTIPRPAKSVYLPEIEKSHQFQGALNDCGPFAAAIILNALLGLELDGAELGTAMNRPHWRGPLPVVRRLPGWATFPWGVVDVLKENGVQASWRAFGNFSALFENLDKNHITVVVIGEWKPVWAHYLILAEFSPSEGWGFIDPASQTAKLKWIEPDAFYRLWKNYLRLVITVVPPAVNRSEA